MRDHVISIDVGTGSARAGVFDQTGRLLARAEAPIKMHKPKPNFVEQSSDDIWAAVAKSVKLARQKADLPADRIAGISFDATCSLVVCDKQGNPVSISESKDPDWNVIVWMDHRASAEARECTATQHEVLEYIGGVMSPEMQTPKLMWLKRHLPETWEKSHYFFDLTDFLTWKSTDSTERSQCTITCKWTYLAHEENGWRLDYLDEIGLEDLPSKGALPDTATPIGESVGTLTAQAAADLGLDTDVKVGAGLIDAHAGTLGLMGTYATDKEQITRHLALIAGTSSCVMAMSQEPVKTHGIWGPYYGAALPELWLSEGGQSISGALLDHILQWHSQGGEASAELHQKVTERIQALRDEAEHPMRLAQALKVLPDFHGNRSPLADPNALGVISGLSMDSSFDSLCQLYWRTCVGIALGIRHVLHAMNKQGYTIDTIHITGGHIKNPLLMELYAEATGCRICWSQDTDAVLLGTAMVAATAAGLAASLPDAGEKMQAQSQQRLPTESYRPIFEHEFAQYLLMQEQRQALVELGQSVPQ